MTYILSDFYLTSMDFKLAKGTTVTPHAAIDKCESTDRAQVHIGMNGAGQRPYSRQRAQFFAILTDLGR